MKAEEEKAGKSKAGAAAKKKGNGSGAAHAPDSLNIFRGMDDKSIVEVLIRDRGFSFEQAVECLAEVKAEIKSLDIKELSTKLLKELVESKVQEMRLRMNIPKPEDSEKEEREESALQLTENARRVLERRYLKKDASGKPVEIPEEMFRRVARTIAEVDRLYDPNADVAATEERFYKLMTSFEFMPNSPTLMNAGRELGQLSACFVIPVEDSLDSIFEAVKHTALIHKSGGGTGFSFSRLRPAKDVVKSTMGVASGPISFMRVFDSATEEIKQGGTRRGANMGILSVDHPDILDFIKCKEDTSRLTNFNISVALTEEFMEAVEQGRDYPLRNPRSGEEVGHLPARMVFDLIVEQAWKTGEPGIVFIDRINRDNPVPGQGRIESTNPCGEQPLLPYESCNLGSINLAKVVREGRVDWDKLRRIVHESVHFLDNVIDANRYPLPQIEEKTKKNRKIGLGVMGFADMLVQLGIPYNSEEAVELAENIMRFIREEGRAASRNLAEQRGPFPAFGESVFATSKEKPLRNATVTTIAPTGTISIIAGASSGIEPYFAISYIRTVMDNDELVEVNPYFERIAKERGFYSEELMKKVARSGSIQNLEEIPEDVRRVFVTTYDISPEWHVRMQAAFQKYTDNAVSKTVNFPREATKEDIAKVYRLAYKLGCKGVTVYRDGSRENQVLQVNKKKEEKPETGETPERGTVIPRARPDVIRGLTRKIPTGCGSLYVTINEDEHGMFEVFTNMGKAGGCAASQAEAVSRLISMALRSGIKAEEIVRQLMGISCPKSSWWRGKKVLSCADAIAKAIEMYPGYGRNGSRKVEEVEPAGDPVNDTKPEKNPAPEPETIAAPKTVGFITCPKCGSQAEKSESCVKCRFCGWSEC